MLFWICPQPSTCLLIFSAHSMILSWPGCSIPPGQKPSVPKSWSAPITPNSFCLLCCPHTWAANLLSTDSHTPSWQVLHRMLSQKSYISMVPLATSSYPQRIPPWTSHTETHLTAFFHRITYYHNQLPLLTGVSSLLQEPPHYKRTQWHALEGGSCPQVRSVLSSSAEGVPCNVPAGLTSELSTKLVQFSYLKSKPVLLSVQSSPNHTHWRPAPSCALHSLKKLKNPSLRHQIFTFIMCLTMC